MGRPPKATKLKLLAGNPGKRALPDERPVESTPAVKPAWLNPAQGAVWDELSPERIGAGLLTSITAESFAQLCVYIAQFRLDKSALSGPEISDMRALRNAFGFDPSALAKLGITTDKPNKPNAFAQLG